MVDSLVKRRANREGSICHRKDGRWYARIVVAGQLRHCYRHTQAECTEWLLDVRRQDGQATLSQGGRVTLGDYLDWWLMQIGPGLRPNTLRQYSGLIRHHITPALGGIALADLGPAHLQALYSQHAHSRTGNLIHHVLHHALRNARDWKLIGDNPAEHELIVPHSPRRRMRFLTPEQVRTLLDTARGDRLETLWMLAIYTGMRRGELLGLHWSEVDLERGEVRVERQLSTAPGHGSVFAELKTKGSRRSIAIGPGLVAALKAHRERTPGELVFPSLAGTPLEPRNVVRMFKALLKRAGLPDVRLHDLRHTSGTLMAVAGVHPATMQERLGHADVAVTLGIYTHVVSEMQRAAASALERATGVDGK